MFESVVSRDFNTLRCMRTCVVLLMTILSVSVSLLVLDQQSYVNVCLYLCRMIQRQLKVLLLFMLTYLSLTFKGSLHWQTSQVNCNDNSICKEEWLL